MKYETIAKKTYNELSKEYPFISREDFKLNSLRYEALLEDVNTYLKEEARFREGFKKSGNMIQFPHFFTKINGIFENKKKYKKLVKSFITLPNTFVSYEMNLLPAKNIKKIFYSEKFINITKKEEKIQYLFQECKESNVIEYLTLDKLYFFSDKITEYINSYLNTEKLIINDKLNNKISNILQMPYQLIELFNNWNFEKNVPKCIICQTFNKINKTSYFTKDILEFLNLCGFDILILSPCGNAEFDFYFDINIITLDRYDIQYNFKKNTKIKQQKQQKIFIPYKKLKHLKEKLNKLILNKNECLFFIMILCLYFLGIFIFLLTNIKIYFVYQLLQLLIFLSYSGYQWVMNIDTTKYYKKIFSSFCILFLFTFIGSISIYKIQEPNFTYEKQMGYLPISTKKIQNKEMESIFEIEEFATYDRIKNQLNSYIYYPLKGNELYKEVKLSVFHKKSNLLNQTITLKHNEYLTRMKLNKNGMNLKEDDKIWIQFQDIKSKAIVGSAEIIIKK